MSDIYQILIGIGIIVSVLLFVVWYFRAPPGIGKTDPNSADTNRQINSSGSITPNTMSGNRIDD